MKRRLMPLLLAGALMTGMPVMSHAQNDSPSTTSVTTDDDRGKGLWGLLGLLGLLALLRRGRHDYRGRDEMGTAR